MPKIELSYIPKEPGVYFMKNEADEIIYIGKAKNLKKRVSSYFQKKHDDLKTRVLVSKIAKVDFITTNTEAEAYILENQLIKEKQPRYNIMLKDSKSYPFLAVDYNSPYPRVYRTREKQRKGVKYFGPYPNVGIAESLLKIAKEYLKLRNCTAKIPDDNPEAIKKVKPCLFYQIGKCPGYCIRKVSEADYDKNLSLFIRFLQGRFGNLKNEIENKMQIFSENLEFEKAAQMRDFLLAINEIKDKQRVYLTVDYDIDVFGCFYDDENIFFSVLHFAEGRLLSKRTFSMDYNMDEEELLSQTISRYYEEQSIPEKIYLFKELPNQTDLQDFLNQQKEKGKVELLSPATGVGISLIKMATQNARFEYLSSLKMTKRDLALKKLKEILNLKVEPRRIEGYDIATIEGQWSAGACVSFFEAKPDKKNYRHFSMKYVKGQDDYAMLAETLFRRFRLNNSALPDLILIDGGKGQLNAAIKILVKMGIEIPVISLAKKEELIFLPNRPTPIDLELKDPALQVLVAVRDEVHRFVNRLHNKMRMKRFQKSRLEEIEGVGPKRRQQILKFFKSVENLRKASAEEISEHAKIPLALAQKIKDEL